jgi:hypothetical protein
LMMDVSSRSLLCGGGILWLSIVRWEQLEDPFRVRAGIVSQLLDHTGPSVAKPYNCHGEQRIETGQTVCLSREEDAAAILVLLRHSRPEGSVSTDNYLTVHVHRTRAIRRDKNASQDGAEFHCQPLGKKEGAFS